MIFWKVLRSGLVALAVTVVSVSVGPAESLHIMKGSSGMTLKVALNRAVVLESDVAFSELSVANPKIADIATLSDKTMYVIGKSPGRTTLTLLDAGGRLITNVEVQVAPDISELKQRLREILPGEPIDVRTANDGVVMSGTVSSIQKLDRALELAKRYAPGRVSNLMSVGGTQQVMLKVRFAEMQRSVAKGLTGSIGIGVNGSSVVGATGSNALSTVGATSALVDGVANLPGVRTTGTLGSFGVGFTAGSLEFNLLLEALESKGMVRTLAEPNLTALSGQQATFLAGGEYPIPVQGQNNTVTIQYKPFGVELKFTPTVVGKDTINLKLDASVSGIDSTISYESGGFKVLGFKRRQASSSIEMHSGQSFAIAGLLQDSFTDNSAQVPWLGDLPILGALFRSADFQRHQSELVIIVTPHLVNPTRGEALALPTDRVRPPTEAELFLNGKVAARKRPKKGAAGDVAKQDFSGSYGYVME